ncbi:hypothetical protein MO867_04300 [Microbulbifer sp. OS29]|uniref:Uncharacterized protein n=1 Tax=Microbulbifer okhotskensis TaxID=2926617 RepID=A0A9X2J6J7_9GAMM|nr:hypothetical protein [Microbulbifer okhotskensis]MCO1333556.1 hypothetical protein [Microbulbifer okhotskensis]
MKVHFFASMAAALFAAGCSSTPEIPSTESFITDITELGHRRFTYKATIGSGPGDRGKQPSGGGKGPGGGGKGPGGGGKGPGGGGKGPGGGGEPSGASGPGRNSGDIKKLAKQRMELLLAESSFCPNGWFLIEQTFDQNRAEIIGECRALQL